MQHEKMRQLTLMNKELKPHHDFIQKLIKPSVDIVVGGEITVQSGSRFGGKALLPRDFKWPKHEIGVYIFLGQINFHEIENRPSLLPEKGILSIFYAYDEDGEIFWRDDGYIIAFYWADIDALVVVDDPNGNFVEPRKIKLSGGVDIPRHEDLRKDWPFDTEILYELVEDGYFSDDYMLGYPSFCSLAYDPTPGPEWISLLTLSSHDEFDWCWHDGDKLMVFIEASKLANRDFSQLKADAG